MKVHKFTLNQLNLIAKMREVLGNLHSANIGEYEDFSYLVDIMDYDHTTYNRHQRDILNRTRQRYIKLKLKK